MSGTAAVEPKQGDTYRCEKCGMELKVTADCDCDGSCLTMTCCGEPLKKA